MPGVTVRFEPDGKRATVASGATLHEAAAEAGVHLPAPCGGAGRCGSCRVRVSGAVREPGPRERDVLGAAASRGVRLACMARIEGPGEVVVERIGTGAVAALVGGPQVALEVEPPEARGIACAPARAVGAAVDLGTTTIAVRLHDLATGAVLGETASSNPQAAWGADVLSRVSRVLAGEGRALRDAAAGEIERLVSALLDTPALADATLCEVAVVGNPAMTHLLLGRDVAPLAAAPYEGALVEGLDLDAAEAGMPLLGGARVIVGPAVSAFVGADAVAALMACGLDRRDEPAVLVDLGTNGEVALVAGGLRWATSAAAGPAFEASGISSGMRAEPGAIDRVWLDEAGTLGLATIADAEPAGVCGSGLVDAVAVLLDSGALDSSGRLRGSGPLAERVRDTAAGREVELAPGVALTQNDVRALQLAKAAVQVALEVLVAESGLDAGDVREVVVAGGFGSHLRPSALAALGVVPPLWVERVTFAGNAALTGASMLLLSADARRRAAELARSVRTVPLAERTDFQPRFLSALDFPPA